MKIAAFTISSDKIIEAVLYAVAEKQKIGLDMEETASRAKNELLYIWSKDMDEIENNFYELIQRPMK